MNTSHLVSDLRRRRPRLQTRVLIVGGGVTGTGLARDLALRGIPSILIEKNDLNAGASGGNHGLLHSGARYIETDPSAARECQTENKLLKQLAPQCIEDTGGLFVAVEGDEEAYVADFPQRCAQAGISAVPIDVAEARDFEPELSPKTIAVFAVEDATIDPFRLTIDNIGHAQDLGAHFLPHTRATQLVITNQRIRQVMVTDTLTGAKTTIEADFVVNAAGGWSGEVAALAGIPLRMVFSKGSLLVTQRRITQRIINRLRRASDGDIIVPGGTVSILGTTSVRLKSLREARPTIPEVDQIIDEVAAMIPEVPSVRYIRAFCGVRPLVGSAPDGEDRGVSRGYSLLDHAKDGVENFLTITGGKMTTFRLMAEKAADVVCRHLGVSAPCQTAVVPLPVQSASRWTQPGSAPRYWMKNKNPDDILLCECEMVPQSAIDHLVDSVGRHHRRPSLGSISRRSRIGKGPCQGTFCSLRVAAYLYDRKVFASREGLAELQSFLRERWRGQHPIMWATPLIQAELQEAMHCGLLGLELADTDGE